MTQGNEHQARRRRWPVWGGFGAAVAAFLILVPVLAIQATDDSGGDSDLPAKPADFIGVGWAPDTASHQLDPELAYLSGPNFTVAFSSLEISDTAGIDYRAADGHEFLELAHGSPVTYDPPDSVTAQVVVDGRAHAVDLTEMTARGLVVSVPKGHTATLRVTDEGRTQSIDLRTARRGRDAIPGYYPRVTLSWPTRRRTTYRSAHGCCCSTARRVRRTSGSRWKRCPPRSRTRDGPRSPVSGIRVRTTTVIRLGLPRPCEPSLATRVD